MSPFICVCHCQCHIVCVSCHVPFNVMSPFLCVMSPLPCVKPPFLCVVPTLSPVCYVPFLCESVSSKNWKSTESEVVCFITFNLAECAGQSNAGAHR